MVATFVKRPTSPVYYESVFTSPEDVLLCGSEEEETPEEHRNKRRRVESLAKQYLEGKGLFILTAGLHGPLNEGWANPWASKKSSDKPKDRRISGVANRAVEDTAQRKHLVPISPIDGHSSTLLNFRSKGPSTLEPPHALQPEYTKNSIEVKDHSGVAPYLMQDIGAISHNQNDFRNWDPRELAQVKDKPQNHPRGWLKSDNALMSKQRRRKSKSPSPSPAPRIRERDQAQATPPVSTESLSMNFHSHDIPQEQKNLVLGETYDFGFTPINRHVVSTKLEDHLTEDKQSHSDLQNRRIELQKQHPSKRSHFETNLCETDKLTLESHYAANCIDQKAPDQTIKRDDHFDARELIQEGPPAADQNSSKAITQQSIVQAQEDLVSQAHIEKEPVKNEPINHKTSLQALPPSTYLAEFEYRYAKKPSTSPSTERLSFAESLEVAKREAEIKALKRISFITSSARKKFDSRRSSSDRSEFSQRSQSSIFRQTKGNQGGVPSQKDKIENSKNPSNTFENGNLPPESDAQPEAQVIPAEPAGLAPSGPSTNLLETDKFSILEEGDSYAHLSTQAAILKAEQSFQNEIVSVMRKSPQQQPRQILDGTPKPGKQNQPTNTPPTALRKKHANGAKILTPNSDNEEPMSTQAMVDAISPFAFSTLKKKKRASIAPSPTSPTTKFPPQSPSMATSPSPSPSPSRSNIVPPPLPLSRTHSKPSSSAISLPSFSIAPNGTLTEVFQHDGQRPQQNFDPESWSLDDAIEEASSFLGTWDVESEAKKMAEGSKKMNGSSIIKQKGKWGISS